MNSIAIRALNKSIRHWIRVWEGEDRKFGADECVLCLLFREDNCRGCLLPEFGMTCPDIGSPWRKVAESSYLCDLPAPEKRSDQLNEAISEMCFCLLLVREASKRS